MQVDLLNDAFNTFRDASKRLEQQYAMLESRIEELNEEIAEKNKAMERTRRLAAMGEMAAKIAHEIRNPLGSMAILATLLERELTHDVEKRKLAEHITKGVKTLDNLLSNMLLFATAPGARLKQVDIREVIEESILLTRGHEKKGVTIKALYEGRTLIMGDQSQLRQLFVNIFLNALDAVGEGGSISVRTRLDEKTKDFLQIEIKDTGNGIPEEHLDRIFDPFFSTKDRGTGLGLAIVATVINSHNGSIDVRSTQGQETAFIISLPVTGPRKLVC